MKIVADQHIPFIKQYFSEEELVLIPGRLITANDVRDADMLIVRTVTLVNQALLEHSKVKFVGSVTAGADHLDLSWLKHAGIHVSLASGFNAPPVADYVVSVIAALQSLNEIPATPIRAGIIGIGKVGSLVVKKFSTLQYDMILNDPPRAESESDFSSTPLDDFAELDLVTLHVPLAHREHPTYHFISDEFLKRQKPGCLLINASRGAIIDPSALWRSGRHLKWCFDVWAGEPHLNLQVLAETLISTPHIAGYSIQSKRRGIAMIHQAAIEAGLIKQHHYDAEGMPRITIEAVGRVMTWQEVVLELFNPLKLTVDMHNNLPVSSDSGSLFDEMRLNFNNRYELAFATLVNARLKTQDIEVLQQFGIELKGCLVL